VALLMPGRDVRRALGLPPFDSQLFAFQSRDGAPTPPDGQHRGDPTDEQGQGNATAHPGGKRVPE
jgi:hypothetical protein